MTYSSEAIAFSTIPPSHQVRLEDRVSLAYLEKCVISQDKTGVVALSADEGTKVRRRVEIPVAGIAVLALGPGTSISQAALTSCTRSGATVLFCGGGGVPAYSHATPLTASARWAIAQANLISDGKAVIQAALKFYKRQLGLDMPGGSINVMRGLEGRAIRNTYREMAKKYRVTGFKRDVGASDPVNVGLNISNSMLYGAAASVCASMALNPALGIIHRGDARSLLFDLADLYKPCLSIPVAFACADNKDVPTSARKAIRSELVRQNVLSGMFEAVQEVLRPHLPLRNDDRLIGDDDEVSGHRLYGVDDDGDDTEGDEDVHGDDD